MFPFYLFALTKEDVFFYFQNCEYLISWLHILVIGEDVISISLLRVLFVCLFLEGGEGLVSFVLCFCCLFVFKSGIVELQQNLYLSKRATPVCSCYVCLVIVFLVPRCHEIK